jgi:hypothetical protein
MSSGKIGFTGLRSPPAKDVFYDSSTRIGSGPRTYRNSLKMHKLHIDRQATDNTNIVGNSLEKCKSLLSPSATFQRRLPTLLSTLIDIIKSMVSPPATFQRHLPILPYQPCLSG